MMTVLKHVAKKERFHLPEEAASAIIDSSNGNMRKALLVFEALRMQRWVAGLGRCPMVSERPTDQPRRVSRVAPPSPDLTSNIEIAKPDWETYCSKVADLILQEQSPKRLMDVRGKVYELLSHCIPATVVLRVSVLVRLRNAKAPPDVLRSRFNDRP
jgi:replication factor C subunit 3/5